MEKEQIESEVDRIFAESDFIIFALYEAIRKLTSED